MGFRLPAGSFTILIPIYISSKRQNKNTLVNHAHGKHHAHIMSSRPIAPLMCPHPLRSSLTPLRLSPRFTHAQESWRPRRAAVVQDLPFYLTTVLFPVKQEYRVKSNLMNLLYKYIAWHCVTAKLITNGQRRTQNPKDHTDESWTY